MIVPGFMLGDIQQLANQNKN